MKLTARALPVGVVPMLATVNRAINYFKLKFSQKVYVQITTIYAYPTIYAIKANAYLLKISLMLK